MSADISTSQNIIQDSVSNGFKDSYRELDELFNHLNVCSSPDCENQNCCKYKLLSFHYSVCSNPATCKNCEYFEYLLRHHMLKCDLKGCKLISCTSNPCPVKDNQSNFNSMIKLEKKTYILNIVLVTLHQGQKSKHLKIRPGLMVMFCQLNGFNAVNVNNTGRSQTY